MAVVRISKELIGFVRRSAEAAYQGKVNEAERIPDGKFEEVYNLLLPVDVQDKMNKLPTCFFRYTRSFRVRVDYTSHSVTLHSTDKAGYRVPVAFDKYVSGLMADCYYDGYICIDKLDARWGYFIRWLEEHEAGVSAATQAQKKAGNAAVALLMKHKSLSPALKEWPALWELLPPYAKEQHQKETPAKTRKEQDKVEPPTLDSDALTELGGTLMIRNLTGKN